MLPNRVSFYPQSQDFDPTPRIRKRVKDRPLSLSALVPSPDLPCFVFWESLADPLQTAKLSLGFFIAKKRPQRKGEARRAFKRWSQTTKPFRMDYRSRIPSCRPRFF